MIMEKLLLVLFVICSYAFSACAGRVSSVETDEDSLALAPVDDSLAVFPCPMITVSSEKGDKTYKVADIYDEAFLYRKNVNKAKCFFVVSKQEFRLYVYEIVKRDTLLAATFPVCYALNKEDKTYRGDNCTPECSIEKPFLICNIQNSSNWRHDFKDGRGSFSAYGKWFMRLNLSKSDCNRGCRNNKSIGIHGCTGNERSIPGMDSEGCIRLRDNDLLLLRKYYAQIGTKVCIKPYDKGKYPFEIRAEQACTNYHSALKGYRLNQ